MKKKLIALISFLCYIICWVQAADEHYYQNFYEFPIKSLNYLVIICFDL